ncbi:ATP-binding protein [Solwaraspora sp. WMMB335]|uniref:ATP-binding protein n=1 Tax=Solwaraspora sp. WMMB335 TaxID=3404118 RepID=UPI003B92B7CA
MTNAASEQEWPGQLRLMQQHPWLALAALSLITIALTATFALISDAPTTVRRAVGLATTVEPGPTAEPTRAAEPGPTAAVVMRSLPRAAGDFTDRSDELSRLVDVVERAATTTSQLPIIAIDGMAGIGKTSFAVHASRRLAARFPDGQLFVNLNGHTVGQRPVLPADALACLLLADGVSAHAIPAMDDQQAVIQARGSLWRSRLDNQRKIIILDNALDFPQIEPLLPGDGSCLVIVTSRRRLFGTDAVTIPLHPLSRADTAIMFTSLTRDPRRTGNSTAADGSGRAGDDGSIHRLVDVSGGLPLAIALLAAQIIHHPSWTYSDLDHHLRRGPHRRRDIRAGHRAVAAAFDLSYHDLPAETQDFFRKISTFPGQDLDRYSAAAVAGTGSDEAQDRLDSLFEVHLIEENENLRYRMHDLVRDYGTMLAGSDMSTDQTDVLQRVGNHYLATLADANWFLSRVRLDPRPRAADPAAAPDITSRAGAIRWLESERANLLACIEQARDHQLHRLVIRLAAAVAPFLRQAGPWDQAAKLHRSAADTAHTAGDSTAEAEALLNLGVVRRMMGSYADALAAFTDALGIYRSLDQAPGQAAVLNQMGIVWYLTGDHGAAEQAQIESRQRAREAGDQLIEANALADLGMVHRQTSRYRSSAQAQSAALEIYRRLEDQYGQANALRDLGVVACQRGDHEYALDCHRQAIDLYRQLDDRLHQAYTLNEMGVVYRYRGQLDAARTASEQALRINAGLGDRFVEATGLKQLAVVQRLAGDAAGAAVTQERALAVFEEIGSRTGTGAALAELGLLAGQAGDMGLAGQRLDRAEAIAAQTGDRYAEAEIRNHRAAVLLRHSQDRQAVEAAVAAAAIAREIECPLEQARGQYLSGLARHAGGDLDGARSDLAEALATYEQLRLPQAMAQVRTAISQVNEIR